MTQLLTFPCAFPIKVMGATNPDLIPAIVSLAQQFDPGFDPETVELRPSHSGNYLGITITINAQSQAHLDDLYRALTSHTLVKVVL